MAKYQNMLVVIDPNQDDQPALRRAVYLHQRIGGRIKAFLPIYDFSYEMTTLLSPDERTAMRQGVIGQRTACLEAATDEIITRLRIAAAQCLSGEYLGAVTC